MVVRDPYKMEKFAQEIYDYSTMMKRVCSNLQDALSSAVPMMKDEVSRAALSKIDVLASELVSGLPAAEDVAEKLILAAKPLKDALSIRM
jgi:hypothetical protein